MVEKVNDNSVMVSDSSVIEMFSNLIPKTNILGIYREKCIIELSVYEYADYIINNIGINSKSGIMNVTIPIKLLRDIGFEYYNRDVMVVITKCIVGDDVHYAYGIK